MNTLGNEDAIPSAEEIGSSVFISRMLRVHFPCKRVSIYISMLLGVVHSFSSSEASYQNSGFDTIVLALKPFLGELFFVKFLSGCFLFAFLFRPKVGSTVPLTSRGISRCHFPQNRACCPSAHCPAYVNFNLALRTTRPSSVSGDNPSRCSGSALGPRLSRR